MLINEVCKKCSLTKKAVEYYMEQRLVAPEILENGYRDFSKEDMDTLQKISVLRGLGISIADIRSVLGESGGTALMEAFRRKALQITVLQEKQNLISELARTGNWQETGEKLCQLQKKESVLERLLKAFPGYYGRYVCLHFGVYLNEPVSTKEQQEAFETIISFLDDVRFSLPDDLQRYLDEAASVMDEDFEVKVSAQMNEAFSDMEKYLADNQGTIESWLAYKQSEEYKNSPACRLKEALRQFSSASGYDEVFIPAMCRLSQTYREYQEALRKADEKFLQRYPCYGEGERR